LALAATKVTMTGQKPPSNHKERNAKNQEEKIFEQADVQLNKQIQVLANERKTLQESSNLINEIDARINELSKKH
jgi:hypothetical protein